MGTWGPGVFDDDVARDVRLAFEGALAQGCGVAEATQAVLDAPPWPLYDEEDAAYTYLALASLQVQLGALEATMRERALAVLASDVPLWRYENASPARVGERMRVLRSLASQLAGDEKPPA